MIGPLTVLTITLAIHFCFRPLESPPPQPASKVATDLTSIRTRIDILIDLQNQQKEHIHHQSSAETELSRFKADWNNRFQGFVAGIIFWLLIDLVTVARGVWNRAVRHALLWSQGPREAPRSTLEVVSSPRRMRYPTVLDRSRGE